MCFKCSNLRALLNILTMQQINFIKVDYAAFLLSSCMLCDSLQSINVCVIQLLDAIKHAHREKVQFLVCNLLFFLFFKEISMTLWN